MVGGNGHANLGSADCAAKADLDFAELTGRGRLGNRCCQSAQHRKTDSDHDVGRTDGDEHVEHVHDSSLLPSPDTDGRSCHSVGNCCDDVAGHAVTDPIDAEAQIVGGSSVPDGE